MAETNGDVLRVRRLEIVDSHGRPRIILSVEDRGGAEDAHVVIFDAAGKERLEAFVDSTFDDKGLATVALMDGTEAEDGKDVRLALEVDGDGQATVIAGGEVHRY